MVSISFGMERRKLLPMPNWLMVKNAVSQSPNPFQLVLRDRLFLGGLNGETARAARGRVVFPVVQPYPKSEGESSNVIAGNEWLLFNLQCACRVFHGLGPFRVSVCKVPFKIAEFGHSSINGYVMLSQFHEARYKDFRTARRSKHKPRMPAIRFALIGVNTKQFDHSISLHVFD